MEIGKPIRFIPRHPRKRLTYAPPLTNGRCLRIDGPGPFPAAVSRGPSGLLPALPGVLPWACGTPCLGVASATSSTSRGGLYMASAAGKETCWRAPRAPLWPAHASLVCSCRRYRHITGGAPATPQARVAPCAYGGVGVTRSVKTLRLVTLSFLF